MERFLTLTAKIPLLLLISMSAIAAVAGEYIAKRWSLNPSPGQFASAVALYACAGALFIPCLLREQLIVVGLLYDILNNSSFLLLGFLVFHERLSRLQIVGACFGIVSLLFFIAAETMEK